MTVRGGLLGRASAKIADLAVPACIKDCELRHVAVNDAYARFYGRPSAEFIGRMSSELLSRPEEHEREDRERRVLVFGEEATALCYDPAGHERHALKVERFLTEDDLPYLFAFFETLPFVGGSRPLLPSVNDAGEIATLAAMIEELPSPMFMRDDANRMILANRAYREISGLSADALIGKTELESFGPAGEVLHRENRRVLETGESIEVEEMFGAPDRRVPVISRRTRLSGVDGRHYLLGSLSDVSALKEREAQCIAAQQEALELHARLELLLRLLPVGVLILDADFRIEYVNDTFYGMWPVSEPVKVAGWSYRDFVAYNHRRGFYGEDAPPADDIYQSRIQQFKQIEEPPVWQWLIPNGRALAVSSKRLGTGRYMITYSDITVLRQREEESQLYRSAIEQVPVPVFVRDEEHRLVFANLAYERMHGGDRQRIIGLTEYDMYPERAEQFTRENARVLEGEAIEKTETFEFEGRDITSITRLGRIVTSAGQRYVVGSVTDVSALKLRERQLEAAQAKAENLNVYLEGIMRSMPIGVLILDSELSIEYANQRVYDIWNWPGDQQLIGLDFPTYAKVNYDRGWRWTEEEDFDSDVRWRMEQLQALDGDHQREMVMDDRQVVITSKRLTDQRVLVTYADISEARRREREISEARAELERIGQQMRDAIRVMSQGLLVIEDGVIVQSNEAAHIILDVPAVSLEPGQSWHVSFAHCAKRGDFGDDPMALLRDWQHKVEDGQGFSATFLIDRRTWVQMEATVSRRGHWMVVLSDITEIKQREQELTTLLERAEAADRAKSEFLANMSHEIRTPMNGVLGMAELLQKSILDARQKTFVDIIVKSGNALLTIINDILDFSKIDAGQLTLRKAPFDPVEAIEDVATLLSAAAAEKDLELIIRAEATLRHLVVGDPGRFRQIVTNLLGNAIKFTERGHVLIELSGEPMPSGELMVTLRISDTGIGIPQEKLKAIFEKFSQVDSSSTRRHEGTGLGLAITAGLVQLFGGVIEVESEAGMGSVFTVHLPLAVAGERRRQTQLPVNVEGARVLVIDDNPVNRQILAEQLQQWGFDGAVAEDAATALAILDAAFQAGVNVDALIVDYHMPDVNGIDFARRVRADRRFDPVAMVFLTSMDMGGDEQVFASLDVQAHLMKPARANVLRGAIIEAVRSRRRGAGDVGQRAATPTHGVPETALLERVPAPVATQLASIDILVAEDNEVNQIVFTQVLESLGMQFHIVGNGREAIEASARLQPRLILMDVSMPVMNGLEATRAIRERERAAGGADHIPIIAVTAHAMDADRDACLAAGMDDYLSKPISPELLGGKIAQWISGPADSIPQRSGG
ncbi:response regulator [Ciceribacter sp. L1K23]|uniref:response regulator n=1 Tax=Ciceribacter sp. L1K23 TaxID=2820276 RepID=UPI001B8228FD|nr:PAS-domain containing protein [Ciceribacter sp. L1K23]MBR0554712.1 response regulator [Ciceribacter sp. L1K23]